MGAVLSFPKPLTKAFTACLHRPRGGPVRPGRSMCLATDRGLGVQTAWPGSTGEAASPSCVIQG